MQTYYKKGVSIKRVMTDGSYFEQFEDGRSVIGASDGSITECYPNGKIVKKTAAEVKKEKEEKEAKEKKEKIKGLKNE